MAHGSDPDISTKGSKHPASVPGWGNSTGIASWWGGAAAAPSPANFPERSTVRETVMSAVARFYVLARLLVDLLSFRFFWGAAGRGGWAVKRYKFLRNRLWGGDRVGSQVTMERSRVTPDTGKQRIICNGSNGKNKNKSKNNPKQLGGKYINTRTPVYK